MALFSLVSLRRLDPAHNTSRPPEQSFSFILAQRSLCISCDCRVVQADNYANNKAEQSGDWSSRLSVTEGGASWGTILRLR